jgi:hypothetical protein
MKAIQIEAHDNPVLKGSISLTSVRPRAAYTGPAIIRLVPSAGAGLSLLWIQS